MKAVYISAWNDPQLEADKLRLDQATGELPLGTKITVWPLVLGNRVVAEVVRQLCRSEVLVLPDDFHRHTVIVEDIKACAYRIGIQVMPITRFLTTYKHSPQPGPGAKAPVRPTEPVGAGSELVSA